MAPHDAAASATEIFLTTLTRNLPQRDIDRLGPTGIAAIAASLWQFAAQRQPGQPSVRITETGSAIEIVNDDMRFLLNSTTAALADLGLVVDIAIHPILAITRDAEGYRLDAGRPDAPMESLMHIALESPIDPARHEAVIARLRATLADVAIAVSDWPAIRAQVKQLAAGIRNTPHVASLPNAGEDASFLDWLDDNNFLFLGTRHYTLDGAELTAKSGLGLLRDDAFLVFDGLRALTRSSPDVQAFLQEPDPVLVSKSNRRSPIQRPVLMDTVIVKTFNAQLDVVGLDVVLGLFTMNSTYHPPRDIPVLRSKIAGCLARSGLPADSHDGHALAHILDSFPRDELFQIDEAQLFDTAIGILHLKQRPGLALFVLRDPFERFSTCLVYLPRDRFNADAARRIGAILEQDFQGRISAETTHFEDATLARLHFVIATQPGQASNVAVASTERKLVEALRNWPDQLAECLPPGDPATLRRYANAFPAAYRDRFPAAVAVADMAHVEAVLAGDPIAVVLHVLQDGRLRLRCFHLGAAVPLSDVLPMLENLGVRVINEIPFEITPRDAASSVWLQELELTAASAPDAAACARFEDAFRQVWSAIIENDGFNRLVLAAGLSAREVVVLRTYAKLLRQAGFAFSQGVIETALCAYPALAALLVRLFDIRANPALTAETRTAQAEAVAADIQAALVDVSNLDDDRIISAFLQLISKTLRTNYYQRDAAGQPKSYLSIKLASRELDLLPAPRPLVEIFVASPRMEGCHLRGGKVARGGIRWSDRREDFRTEILGLMKAQIMKNAVIVPIGSKGGFVPKKPATGTREEIQAEAIACYKILMSGLLDLTDNIVAGQVVPPPDVVRHDPDDTYLVVAADKGTATFSDIANSVSRDYGFWLDDAFASGGSVGYDHKVMGITAKGAWEAVKRHFREIGTNIQAEDFTCIGVGDMSGDVFGNGMMLSEHTKLLAAFNHMHIFIDPDPVPSVSFAERVRMFNLPRSGWNDYDTRLISPGGGVFERRAKSIPLSAEMRARFGLSRESMAPSELIQALLRYNADLLWFGGIGTYVKASTEAQSDAGDRANDALRVNASELRCKVVGEGANLAITQRARIEFALAGGRINTDAIDNSAGVDTSDHEVNIKIATGDVIAAGLVPQAERTSFLASMTDEVERLVLADNYLQTQILSVVEAQAPALLESHAGLMRAMERSGQLDRGVEFLPDDDAIAARAAARKGLVRPELAVLLAYAKNGLYDALLVSDLPDLAALNHELLAYFPARLRDLAPHVLISYRLRREVIATVVANALINRMGPSFVHDTMLRTGASADAIARAFLITSEVFSLPSLWADIEALDNLAAAATQTRLHIAIATIIDQAVRWFLLSGDVLDPAVMVAKFKPGVLTLTDRLTSLLPESEREIRKGREAAHIEAGVPQLLAERIVVLTTLSTAMDIIEIADQVHGDLGEIGRLYFAVGAGYGLLLIRRKSRQMVQTTGWQRLAADALADDSTSLQREITAGLAARGSAVQAADIPAALLDILGEIGRTTPPDLAMLTVASRRIRAAAAGM
jgi:glutamate dehydrogenase